MTFSPSHLILMGAQLSWTARNALSVVPFSHSFKYPHSNS